MCGGPDRDNCSTLPPDGGAHTHQVRTHAWDSDHVSHDAWSQEVALGC